MSNDTMRLGGDDGSLAGDALLHAVRQDMQGLFGLVKALDAKVEARLRDTTPMWEVVVTRLDTIVTEQESHGRHLDAIKGRLDGFGRRLDGFGGRLDGIDGRLDGIDGRLDGIDGRLDAIEIKLERFDAIDSELRHLRRRIERTIGQLSKDVVEYRVDQHDLEDRLEKLEKTPA